MLRSCPDCHVSYNDFLQLTICPHNFFTPNPLGQGGAVVGMSGGIPTHDRKPPTRNRFRFTVEGTTWHAIETATLDQLRAFFGDTGFGLDWTSDVTTGTRATNTDGTTALTIWTADVEYRW